MTNLQHITKVNIGVQARTTSKRFPKKVLTLMGDKPIIDHVLDACRGSARYINRHTHRTGIKCYVNLLIPYDDHRLATPRPGINIYEGDEMDVMSRYVKMQEKNPSDYLVRVTADCPLIRSALISKAITIAIRGEYDYLTNAMPGFRTFYDGADIEVLSNKLLGYLNGDKSSNREHVTSSLKNGAPSWVHIGHIFNEVDNSNLKLSVDTEEDLKNVEEHFNSVQDKIRHWSNRYGHNTCHRF